MLSLKELGMQFLSMTALWLEITSGEKATTVFLCSVVQVEYRYPPHDYLIDFLKKACSWSFMAIKSTLPIWKLADKHELHYQC